MSHKQTRAIKRAIELGRTLQTDHPNIAKLYESLSRPQIIEELKITDTYEVTHEIAKRAITLAIRGYDKGLDNQNYKGLIEDIDKIDEIGGNRRLETLARNVERGVGFSVMAPEEAREHASRGGSIGGQLTYSRETGVHGLSPEEKREVGMQTYRDKLGIHAQTPDQRKDASRKGLHAQGKVPWSIEEVQTAYELYTNPTTDSITGLTANQVIEILNETFHRGVNVRTSSSLRTKIKLHKKSLEALASNED